MKGAVTFCALLVVALASNPEAVSAKCNFESGLCSGWSQLTSDQFDWTVKSGGTPSVGTGPTGDHTTGSGKYIYIEASYPRVPGDKAVVSFSGYNGGAACLSFYYHMLGKEVKELNVYVGLSQVFSKSGDQGSAWEKAEVSINGNGNIMFEATVGSWQGDIAIDDFSLTGGSCSGGGATPPPPNPATTQPPPAGNCGMKPHARIVGGTAAQKNGWPWQAMLRIAANNFPFCGGTLVAPQWVLSAAHCVKGKSPGAFQIRMGAHARTTLVGTEQDFNVVKIIPHQSYHSPLRYSHDIALLKLDKPAILNKVVGLACIPDANTPALPIDSPSKKCWITGWGRLASGGATPNILQQASVPLVSKSRCLKGYPGKIHDSMLCAGLDQGGVDACQGDSGGPLVCEHNGRWYIEGATSWGHGCAGPMKYGVYAKVRYERAWIDSTMKNN